MRLLLVTQEINRESSTLGFFHEWVNELASRIDSIEVICLKEGHHTLPANVRVHSLGKEHGRVWAPIYAYRFLAHAWRLRGGYDRVLVHMNQEYVLLAGLLWKWLGTPIYLWRNHYRGSWATDVAASLCTKVFCTSRHSYTAQYTKTVLMPVGVEVAHFTPVFNSPREPHSILFLARISPSKHLDVFIEALRTLNQEGVAFTASVVGDALPEHTAYIEDQKQRAQDAGLEASIQFLPGVPHHRTPAVFGTHAVFVNCAQSGMFDKTLFEASAAGCIVLAVSEDFAQLAGDSVRFTDSITLAQQLKEVLKWSPKRREAQRQHLQAKAKEQSLGRLCDVLIRELYS